MTRYTGMMIATTVLASGAILFAGCGGVPMGAGAGQPANASNSSLEIAGIGDDSLAGRRPAAVDPDRIEAIEPDGDRDRVDTDPELYQPDEDTVTDEEPQPYEPGDDTVDTGDVIHAGSIPVITSLTGDPAGPLVMRGGQVNLFCKAYSPLGEPLTYEWYVVDDGWVWGFDTYVNWVENGSQAQWVAVNMDGGPEVDVAVVVTTPSGGEAVARLTYQVVNIE